MRLPSSAAAALLLAAAIACAGRRPAPEPVGAQSAFAPDGCAAAAEISQRSADSTALVAPVVTPSGRYVLARFYIDAAGKPEMQTFEVIRASDPALVARTREMVAKARYRAYEPLPGCPVRGLVVQPFTFPGAGAPPE